MSQKVDNCSEFNVFEQKSNESFRKDGSCPLAICYKDPENHVVLNVDK